MTAKIEPYMQRCLRCNGYPKALQGIKIQGEQAYICSNDACMMPVVTRRRWNEINRKMGEG